MSKRLPRRVWDLIEQAVLHKSRELFFIDAQKPPGTLCDTCGKFGKVYHTPFSAPMARNLIWLWWKSGGEPGIWQYTQKDGNRDMLTSNCIGKLRYWHLAVAKPNEDDPAKKESGIWAMTEAGKQFVERRRRVPSHCDLFADDYYPDEQAAFLDSKPITIADALKVAFHYETLMSTGVWPFEYRGKK